MIIQKLNSNKSCFWHISECLLKINSEKIKLDDENWIVNIFINIGRFSHRLIRQILLILINSDQIPLIPI